MYLLSKINLRLDGWFQTRPTTVSLSSLTDNTLNHKCSSLKLNLINIINRHYEKLFNNSFLKKPLSLASAF